jgi:hypothetical protein
MSLNDHEQVIRGRGTVLRLSLWQGGPVDEGLALAGFHGQWIEWRAGA